MLNKDKFVPLFGDWWEKIEPFFEKGGFDEIYTYLKMRGGKGYHIFPEVSKTYRAFRETPLASLNAVVMGMCPYHNRINGIPVADGLLMGCSNHDHYVAPSLDQYYNAIEEEFKEGLCLPCIRTGDLTYLSSQGVLLLNAALTVEEEKAGSHNPIWKPFIEYLFLEVIGYTEAPVVLMGEKAQFFYGFLGILQWSFCISHPASASYKGQKWSSENAFHGVNKVLEDQGKPHIQWIMDDPPF